MFAPLAALMRRGHADPSGPLPPDAVARLWRVLRREDGSRIDAVVRDVTDLTEPDLARRTADALAVCAAQDLLAADGAWADLRRALDGWREGGAEALSAHLKLVPLARACTPRLRTWMRTASAEHASGLRLAYRDAGAIGEEAPTRLLEMLAAQLDHDWQILRLVAAVMDRPSDSFLAASELGRYAEQVLDQVDDRVQAVRGFDPGGGAAAGRRAADGACAAVQALSEFDRSIDLRPDGPWAKRIAAQRRNLGRGVETRLRQADGALARALPLAGSGLGGRARGAPKLDAAFDPVACAKAAALVAFVAGVRPAADFGGFTVLRAKAAEALDLRLSLYADDLVSILHEGDEDRAEAARARLAFVAECLSQVRDPKAAEVIRRRVAAA